MGVVDEPRKKREVNPQDQRPSERDDRLSRPPLNPLTSPVRTKALPADREHEHLHVMYNMMCTIAATSSPPQQLASNSALSSTPPLHRPPPLQHGTGAGNQIHPHPLPRTFFSSSSSPAAERRAEVTRRCSTELSADAESRGNVS